RIAVVCWRLIPLSDSVLVLTARLSTLPRLLSLHAALPIWRGPRRALPARGTRRRPLRARDGARGAGARLEREAGVAVVGGCRERTEEHTSELQSRRDVVCRLQLEKKHPSESAPEHPVGTAA